MTRRHFGLLALAGTLCSASAAQAASVNLEGRLHIDYGYYDEDRRTLGNGFILRRARIGFGGELESPWSYKLEVDFGEGDLSVKGAWFRYTGWEAGMLTLGQFKVPFGLSVLESSNTTTFIERSLPSNAFAPARRVGIGFQAGQESWNFRTMAFGQAIGADIRQSEGDEGLGVAARFVFHPVVAGHQLHFGVASTLEEPASSVREEVQFESHPEARPTDVSLVSTGAIPDVDFLNRLGLETAWQSGSLLVEAEWMRVAVDRKVQPGDPQFQGYSLSASWILTGEAREYSGGWFEGVEPQGQRGAWELGLRYSGIDLDSGLVEGGEQHNLTLGLNWYLNSQIRFMTNLIKVQSRREGQADDPLIMLFRGQISF